MRELGAPGELLFCAGRNKQLAMYVEKVMQTNVLYHETISQKKIKLLQLTAGNGMLKQGPPYKVGVRFFHSEKIKEMGLLFKDSLSIKQQSLPKLPNNEGKAARVSLNSKSTDSVEDTGEEYEHEGKVARKSTDSKSTDSSDKDTGKEYEHEGKVARVSLNSKSTDSDEDASEEYEQHGGVNSCARSSSRTRQQTNFFAEYGKYDGDDDGDDDDDDDGDNDGDEDDGDEDDGDDDDDIIDLTMESED
jgi:hypothetical protein